MTLFLYVLRDFFKYVFGTLALVVFLFVLFDFIHKTTRYIPRYNPETALLIKYYVYQLPNLILQALPIASLLASVVCMVLLSRTNEVTAMRAAGMGPLRIGAPIAVGGLTLCFISIVLGEWILPKSASRMHYVQEVEIEKGSDDQLAEGARWVRSASNLYHFKEFDPLANRLTQVRMIEVGPSFRPKRIIDAPSASYQDESGEWILGEARITYFWPNGTVSYTEKKSDLVIDIPAEPQKLKRDRRLPNELSLNELQEIIGRGAASGADILSYKVDMQVKLAFHFASFVVSLIGLKFGYKSERSMETAKGILLAIAIGVSYWFILNSGRALSKRGSLPPWVGAWSANVIIFVISWISIVRAKKS
ncbi:MAG: LPS export ABC transporter permease LptG [Oligoflexus sp.]